MPEACISLARRTPAAGRRCCGSATASTIRSGPIAFDSCSKLRVSTPFQALVLQRLEPEARKTYNYGGFTEPHVPRYVDASPRVAYVPRPAPPTLGLSPIAGVCSSSCTPTTTTCCSIWPLQSRTTAEADWESFKYLFSLIASTALMFLPARLSIPMVVWQSLGSLQQGLSLR